MTRLEQIDLSDALANTQHLIERAMMLADVMINDYFDKYDPEKNDFAIHYEFKRQGHFAALLRDQLIPIENTLPAAEWVNGLKCEEADA